jgi:hypothetical protein
MQGVVATYAFRAKLRDLAIKLVDQRLRCARGPTGTLTAPADSGFFVHVSS